MVHIYLVSTSFRARIFTKQVDFAFLFLSFWLQTNLNSYKIIAHRSERQNDIGEQFYCSYDGMLDVRSYKHSHQDIDEYFKFLTE